MAMSWQCLGLVPGVERMPAGPVAQYSPKALEMALEMALETALEMAWGV